MGRWFPVPLSLVSPPIETPSVPPWAQLFGENARYPLTPLGAMVHVVTACTLVPAPLTCAVIRKVVSTTLAFHGGPWDIYVRSQEPGGPGIAVTITPVCPEGPNLWAGRWAWDTEGCLVAGSYRKPGGSARWAHLSNSNHTPWPLRVALVVPVS